MSDRDGSFPMHIVYNREKASTPTHCLIKKTEGTKRDKTCITRNVWIGPWVFLHGEIWGVLSTCMMCSSSGRTSESWKPTALEHGPFAWQMWRILKFCTQIQRKYEGGKSLYFFLELKTFLTRGCSKA